MIQSLVSDAVSRAMDHLYTYRQTCGDIYRIVLQIHDALMLEVPIKHIEKVWNEVLPVCMVDRVPLFPTLLDGSPRGDGPYYLSIGKECFIHWGEKITHEEAKRHGIPEFVLE